MPSITTWINESQFEAFKKQANRENLNAYHYTKKLILADLAKTQRDHAVRTTICFGFTLYSLVASVIVMVL